MVGRRILLITLTAGVVVLALAAVTQLLGTGSAQSSQGPAAEKTSQGRVFEGNVGNEDHPLEGVTVSLHRGEGAYPNSDEFPRSTTMDSEGWFGLTPTDDERTIQGRVFEGDVGNEDHPLEGVTVSLYRGEGAYPDLGEFLRSTTTDSEGWYGLTLTDGEMVGYGCAQVLETDPAGYVSVGATTVSGTVRTSNWIEFATLLAGKNLTGNKFWDRIPVLSGRVYEGETWDESSPLSDVTVGLYCSSNPALTGTLILTTVTDAEGWYGLPAQGPCEYFNVIEQDPPGYHSVEATTVSGTVRSNNWIEYAIPLNGKTLTGNKLWDLTDLSDLVMLGLSVEPDQAYPDEEVLLAAEVYNSGPYDLSDVEVRFAADEAPFYNTFIDLLPSDTSVVLTDTKVFTAPGTISLSATVNPGSTLPERRADNNTSSAELVVVWEKSPGWARPDLTLTGMVFAPHRPEPEDTVQVVVELSNLRLYGVPSTTVVLRVDDVGAEDAIADVQLVEDIGPGETRPVTLTWPAAAAGRHLLVVLADPEMLVEERSESNNRIDEWIRVRDPDVRRPLPDLEIEGIELGAPSLHVGGTIVISVEVHNEGYGPVEDLPVRLTLDGHQIADSVIARLDPDESVVVAATWADISEGQHTLGAWADPEDVVLHDSVKDRLVKAFIVPGTAYQLPGQYSPTRWRFIGPDSINNGAYTGRLESVAISDEDSSRIVVGAHAGGVWLTTDGGANWSPLADHLPSPGFSVVAFDPADDSIIYAATGSSSWGGGTGLYKSTDSGASWTKFADTWLGAGYGDLILRYTDAYTLTIYAGTDTGVWMWQGDESISATKPSEWQRIWQQSAPGKAGRITDMLVTAEATPQMYIAVQKDSVYRASLSDPTNWTPLNAGLPPDPTTIELGNSAADPDLVYAAVKRQNGHLEIHRRAGGGSWVYRSRPSDQYGTKDTYNAFVAVHPSNADAVYLGGVVGWRSLDGGLTFPTIIPHVHVDYKAYAFDPDQASTVYFVSDGGIYRCTSNTGAMSCAGLNRGLGTTELFDIALAATQISRTMGGTQDNGTILGDGTAEWINLSHSGDGMYVAIDPAAPDTLFGQYQYIDSVKRTTTVSPPDWQPASTGLPTLDISKFEPFMTMHPGNGQVLLATWDQVLRTTNAGGLWSKIGPLLSVDPINHGIKRIAIDATNDRYYAATTWGRVYAVPAGQAGPISWTQVYTHPHGQSVRGLLVDPDDADIVYATFSGGWTWRVVKLEHSGGWPGTWAPTDITGNLPGNRPLGGGPGSWGGAVRGLLKAPGADALFVGTHRGVYQGRPVGTSWQWFPDTCGLPLTFVSDLELHPSGTVMRAATFGRSAYERSVPLVDPVADAYDWPTRNDTLAAAAAVSGTWSSSWLQPGLTVEDLSFDRLNDIDYYSVQLPTAGVSDCLPAGDPSLSHPMCSQCSFDIVVHAPDTPDPFELRLYGPGGGVLENPGYASNLSYRLERPRDVFPGGVVTLSVRSPTGCQSWYDLYLSYQMWNCEKEVPELLYEPPLFRWVVPEGRLQAVSWMFPGDPALINKAFVGQAPKLPDQRLIFHWDHTQDFVATFTVEGSGSLDGVLYDAGNNPVGGVARDTVPRDEVRAAAAVSSTKQITVADLEAGWYALEIGNGEFPTYFRIDFNTLYRQKYLPIVMRE